MCKKTGLCSHLFSLKKQVADKTLSDSDSEDDALDIILKKKSYVGVDLDDNDSSDSDSSGIFEFASLKKGVTNESTLADSDEEDIRFDKTFWENCKASHVPVRRHVISTSFRTPIDPSPSPSLTIRTEESTTGCRVKPEIPVGKTIRKRKNGSAESAGTRLMKKAQRVLQLDSCASALQHVCKCKVPCSGSITPLQIQQFRKEYWDRPAKVSRGLHGEV